MNVIEILKTQDGLFAGTGVSQKVVEETEKVLKVTFAADYRLYLMEFGVTAVNGHELTGISSSERTNVVDGTIAERQKTHKYMIPKEWYLIEDLHIDDVTIWQDSSGKIYQVTPNSVSKVCDSLGEYILK